MARLVDSIINGCRLKVVDARRVEERCFRKAHRKCFNSYAQLRVSGLSLTAQPEQIVRNGLVIELDRLTGFHNSYIISY